MSRDLSVQVEFLTRVEGHGNIIVSMKDGKLEECRLDIIEAPRFFEAMLKGRSIFEAQHITSRICGICACGHTLASIQAAEDAIGFTPSPQTTLLRRLLLHMENLDSHILHIYMLVAPDLLGKKSFIQMLNANEKDVRRALRMKKTCNDVCEILVGRHIHPISATIGGFTKLPKNADIDSMQAHLISLREDLDATVELMKKLKFPEFSRETEYVALVSDGDDYPMLAGEVGSSDGVRKPKELYREITNEYIVPHSTAKHAKLSRESYAVGAMARFNLNNTKLHPRAKEAAMKLGLVPPCTNPFMNTVAQLVECIHFTEDALDILDTLRENGIDQSEVITVAANEHKVIKVQKGNGFGAVEVPRGLLFHNYEVDENGIITKANCVIPTGQNLGNIERDMQKLVPEIATLTDEEITLKLEMLVRAYDPCISCSTHNINITLKRD